VATNNSLSEWDKLELLGTGGNGEVWRAKRNGVECAVKILKKTKVDDESYRRFIDEIKILRDLGHDPGVLPIFDAYLPESPSKRNRAWLSMPLATGIKQALEERPRIEDAHARLVVIGGDTHRLHEEIITAGGFVKEGRFSRMNVGQISDTLAGATDEVPSKGVCQRFLDIWDTLSLSLQQSLEAILTHHPANALLLD